MQILSGLSMIGGTEIASPIRSFSSVNPLKRSSLLFLLLLVQKANSKSVREKMVLLISKVREKVWV
jgi:hypothetical protein